MNKEQILNLFENYFDTNERDSGYAMTGAINLANSVYRTDKEKLIEILREWLQNDNDLSTQHLALYIIKDLKIQNLKPEVQNLILHINKNKKSPLKEAELKLVDNILSNL